MISSGPVLFIVMINRDVMHAGDEMSRNGSIHHMHLSYFYATNCGANCLGASCLGASCLWNKSSLLFAQLPCWKYSGLACSPVFQQGFRCTLMYLSYHIEINPKWPMTETSRIGTPPKFIQTEKSRPKWPKFCYLHSYHAEIIWTGLLSHSSAKKLLFFLCANLRNIGSGPHSIKNVNKADTLWNRTQLGIRKMLGVHDTHISKNNWVFHI